MFKKANSEINNLKKDITCNHALHVIECMKKHQDNIVASITAGPLTKRILINTQDINVKNMSEGAYLISFNEYYFSFKTMGLSTDFATLKWIDDATFDLELISNHKIQTKICFIAELKGIKKDEYFIK
ncbi:hypothetical protein [Bacillus thuringiensis]|uniref:hypothetical protein n=1 Tax=Bacillus thuringiensis TaxID=1428 RepID=UPI0028689879|nr:hypothetical protein [Bacillus thuringiensis]